MKKFFVSIAVAVMASVSQACASAGYTGFNGISFPGYEAAGVAAANAMMPYQILAAGQYGAPYGYGNVPVCRLQDLQGLPPVSQPVIVRVSKSRGHRVADILGAATVVGGIVYINTGDLQAAGAGVLVGGGGGLLWTNHEQELCLFLPVKTP